MALKRKRPQPSSASASDQVRQKLAERGSDVPRERGRERHSFGGRGSAFRGNGGKRPAWNREAREAIPNSSLQNRDLDGDGSAIVAVGRKRALEAETRSYFLEIYALIDGGGPEAEDAELICVQALAEAQGHELQLACDASCGRVVESLLRRSSISQNLQFLLGCSATLVDMATDASGSHIVEQVLKSVAGELFDENVREVDWYNSLELTLTQLCHQLGHAATLVMTNKYGSHVLRCLLSLLSGNSSEILSPAGNDGNITRGLAGKVGAFSRQGHGQKPRPRAQAFPGLLKSLVSMIMENCEGKMARLRGDVSGGPVLQVLLSALKDLEMNEDLGRAIGAILGCDPRQSGEEDGELLRSVPVEEILVTIEHKNSSHLMEVIIRIASDALYLEIFRRFLRKRILQLSLHPSANFIIQVLIACARHEGQVNMIFEELEGNFAELVKDKRTGVIAALLAACGRFRTRQKEACRALVAAVKPTKGSASLDLVPHLLQMDVASDDGSARWDKSSSKLSVIGSVILQIVLTFPQDCSQQFCASVAAMESAGLLRLVTDWGGSRVIEVFLDSSTAPLKHKARVISKLEGHFAELALHPVGCFVVERCFGVAEIKRKEKIAAELAPVQADLLKTRSGARVSRRCDVACFVENPEQWGTKQSSRQNTQRAFVQLFQSGGEQDFAEMHEEEEVFVRKRHKGYRGS